MKDKEDLLLVRRYKNGEEFFSANIEQGLKELTLDESEQFIEIMKEKYIELKMWR